MLYTMKLSKLIADWKTTPNQLIACKRYWQKRRMWWDFEAAYSVADVRILMSLPTPCICLWARAMWKIKQQNTENNTWKAFNVLRLHMCIAYFIVSFCCFIFVHQLKTNKNAHGFLLLGFDSLNIFSPVQFNSCLFLILWRCCCRCYCNSWMYETNVKMLLWDEIWMWV